MKKIRKKRAVIEETVDSLKVTIPIPIDWGMVIIAGGFAGLGIFLFIRQLPKSLAEATAELTFWALFIFSFTLGVVLEIVFLNTFWGYLNGREVITVQNGELTWQIKGPILSRVRYFDLKKISNLSVEHKIEITDEVPGTKGIVTSSDPNLIISMIFPHSPEFNNGYIKFRYELQEIRIGNYIDVSEAEHIVARLLDRGMLKARNMKQIL